MIIITYEYINDRKSPEKIPSIIIELIDFKLTVQYQIGRFNPVQFITYYRTHNVYINSFT